MAGPEFQYEVMVGKDLAIDSTGDKADWAPGHLPHYIRAVDVIVTNAIGATGVIKVDKRPTAGDDTSRGDGDIATINLTTAHTVGKVVHKEINVLLIPGQEAVVEVTDAAAGSDTAHVVFLVEPSQERPLNNSNMVATS